MKQIKNFNIIAKKFWGQNFLVNEQIAERIAKNSLIDEECGAIEIGPAYGMLTKKIAPLYKKVVVIEIDRSLISHLKETLFLNNINNVKIINGNILKQNLKELITKEFNNLNVVVVSNLPYYITTPIIMKLMEEKLGIRAITVMVQKEVAIRLCALPKSRDFSSIGFTIRYYSNPKRLFNVSRGNFKPIPSVDSSVVKFNMRQNPPVEVANEKLFFSLIKESFKCRRKTILNSLSDKFGFKKSALEKVIDSCNIDINLRPEQLGLEEFAMLANKLELISLGKLKTWLK